MNYEQNIFFSNMMKSAQKIFDSSDRLHTVINYTINENVKEKEDNEETIINLREELNKAHILNDKYLNEIKQLNELLSDLDIKKTRGFC